MKTEKPVWRIKTLAQMPDDEAQIYLPQGSLTQSYERHLDAPVVLYQRTTPSLESRGNKFPIFGYYLGGEANPLLERMAIANLMFQGLWVLPVQGVNEEEKHSTGEGLPFNDGQFTFNGQLYRVEVTAAYPRYTSGENLRGVYGRASAKAPTLKPQGTPRIECTTCQDTEDVCIETVDGTVPHPDNHTWICWFPAGWPGSEFPDQQTAQLSPIDDGPKAMATAMQDAIRSKADKLRQNPLEEPVCLIVVSQGFPIPDDDEWIAAILAEASLFDTVLSVHVDGYIGFMENDSFSYQGVGQFLKCPLCLEDVEHEHKHIFTMIRHQFDEAGTWVIHATTNEETHQRNKHATWATAWHQVKL